MRQPHSPGYVQSPNHGQRSENAAMATRTLNRLSANLDKPLAERGYYADGGGLYFRVSEFGTRLWAFRYARAGRAREMGLGPYPEVTLKDARELALEDRKLLRADLDPIEKRQARKSALAADRQVALTVVQCAAAFIAVKEKEWKNAKHGEPWRATLATYADPVIGRLLVRDVQQAHILKILEPIWTPRPRPLPACVVASRTCWTTPPPGLSQCGQPSALARPPRQDSGHAEQGGKG